MKRFREEDVAAWRDEGFALIPGFFLESEIAPVREDYLQLYGRQGLTEARSEPLPEAGHLGAFREDQFRNIDTLPYEGGAEMNLLSLHPALIEFAKQLLGVPQV